MSNLAGSTAYSFTSLAAGGDEYPPLCEVAYRPKSLIVPTFAPVTFDAEGVTPVMECRPIPCNVVEDPPVVGELEREMFRRLADGDAIAAISFAEAILVRRPDHLVAAAVLLTGSAR